MSVMNQCFVCGTYYKIGEGSRLVTCSDKCHEQFVQHLIREFGEFKRVCSTVTGKCYRVPTRVIIEKGLTHDELVKFPECNLERT